MTNTWLPRRSRRGLDVTVVIGTYGDGDRWIKLARERAWASLPENVPSLIVHRDTLAEARNAGAAMADTEWLCFLDADDELEPGYFDIAAPQVDVIVPRVHYVYQDRSLGPVPSGVARWPRVAGHGYDRHDEPCTSACLTEGNFIVVGAPVRRSLFERVGGFRDLPVYEDYDLWVRCWRAGARFGRVEGSVYRVHVRPDGRNQGLTAAARRAVQDAIVGEGW